jgi:ATP-binding cassette, subfamily B, bacterial
MSAPRRESGWTLWRTLPRVLPYLRPYRKLLWLSGLFTVLAAAVSLAEPWPLAMLVDNVLSDHPPAGLLRSLLGDPDKYTLLVIAVSGYFLLAVLANAMTLVNDYFNANIEQRMILDLRSDLFEHCQRLSLTFHDARQTGALMSQINIQAAALGTIVMAFPPMIQALLTLVGMFVIALLIDWMVALAALVVLPFLFWSFGLYGQRVVPRLQRVQRLEWQSLSIVHEAMSMLRVIVSFGRERHEHRRFREQGEVAVEERIRLTVSQNLYRLGVTTATAAGTALVLGIGAWHVIDGKITIGELLVLMNYIAAVYAPLEQISVTVGTLHEQLVQFNASVALLDQEPEVKDAPDAVDLGRVAGQVAFEDVHFAYTGRREAIRGVSLEAQPGERVAIVGPTGAGKTTLVSLLLRFYDPSAGRISIDGVDLRRLNLQSLRAQISVVLQEPLLFSGTIAENIRYGRLDAGQEDIVTAAEAANCHGFITRLPDGYDTVLGERGAQLSGGERQRIAVARAFLRDAPILLLDEPTSSIDSRTESVILDALDELMVGRTSFMIAHRLSTVRHADKIAVMSEGRIVEVGGHDELIELGGMYKQLFEAQTRQRRRRQGPPSRVELRPVSATPGRTNGGTR